MGYYGRRYNSNRQPRQNNPELVERIEKTAARGTTTLTAWERDFLSSLRESAKKWGRLTAKQHDTYQRIERKLDPSHQKAVSDWRNNFTDEMRLAAVFAANYYKANPPYFSDAATRILNDSSYIPSEKLYRKMVLNKYVQRAMEHAKSGPLYKVGSMVKVRNSQSVTGQLRPYRDQPVLIVEAQEEITSATKGARKYKVLPIGADRALWTEERYLKK
ncbi:MAG: hypothetical protein VYC40_01795 [Pseudomonadota bacterium]|nr:hypothetical protein [Pseudomonadota bacterium]